MKIVQSIDDIPSVRLCSKAEIAEAFRVTLPTVNAWIVRGCPVVKTGGRGVAWQLDIFAVYAWRHGVSDSHDQDEDPEKLDPKARLDWYKGNRERDIHAKEQGELIPFEIEEKIIGAAFSAVRAGLLSQHNTIASQYPEMPKDAIRGILSANRELLAVLAETRLPDTIASALDEIDDESGAAEGLDSKSVG